MIDRFAKIKHMNKKLPSKIESKESEKAADVVRKDYIAFFKAATEKVLATRIQIAKAACKEQISLYWWFGQHIVKAQENFGWGKAVVERFSKDLNKSFGGTLGFSVQNLWYMRQFYLEYKDYPNLQRLVGDLGGDKI